MPLELPLLNAISAPFERTVKRWFGDVSDARTVHALAGDSHQLSVQAVRQATHRDHGELKLLSAGQLDASLAANGVSDRVFGYKGGGSDETIAWLRSLSPTDRAPVMDALQRSLSEVGLRGHGYQTHVADAIKAVQAAQGYTGDLNAERAANRLGMWAEKTQAGHRLGVGEGIHGLIARIEGSARTAVANQDLPALTRFYQALGYDGQAGKTAASWLKVYRGSLTPVEKIRPTDWDLVSYKFAYHNREGIQGLLDYARTLKS